MVKPDSNGRLPISLKVYPRIHRELTAKAREKGFNSAAYYILYLVGVDLGYLPRNARQPALSRWLKSSETQRARGRRHPRGKGCVAVDALRVLGEGDWSTKEIANEAELSYQQAYRQLQRSDEVEKLRTVGGTRWRLR